MGQVEGVGRLEVGVQLLVGVEVQQMPVQRMLVMPLVELTQLAAHDEQLFAGVGEHIAPEATHEAELLPVPAGHFAHQRAFHMHHLVMGDGQDIVFAEGVHQREGQVPMIVLAEQGIGFQVVAHVVHPAHVPLEVEAQTALVHRVGHLGPGGGLLGDHEHVRILGKDSSVQLLKEVHRLQIFVAAVDVGHPLAVPASVIQIEHGGHGVHTQTVGMVHLQPEHGRGEQEGAYLAAA